MLQMPWNAHRLRALAGERVPLSKTVTAQNGAASISEAQQASRLNMCLLYCRMYRMAAMHAMTQRSCLRHKCVQDDDAAWGQNPFDFSADGVADGTSAESQALADVDARTQEYRGEHIWDEEGYMRSLRYTNKCTVSEHCCELCELLPNCCYNKTLHWCPVAVQLCFCARGKICCNHLTLAQGIADCSRCQAAVYNSHPYGVMHARSPCKPAEHSRCSSASGITAPLLTTTNSFCESDTGSISLIEALVKDDKTDYLAAKRQAKQLASALHNIDATLRELRTSSLPSVPTKAELAFLLESCQK